MALIVWGKDFSVGIESIDEQHKQLIALVNGFHEAMLQRQGKPVMEKLLDGLVDYTIRHFAHEERLFSEHGYQDMKEHKKQHDALAKEVSRFSKDLHAGRPVLSVEVMSFLKEWLQEHIQGTDMKYSAFLKSRGVL
ncbi:MAG TPA: bacteriohemerythrin [Dissulfurispiraceae bacterium]|nr:bacteriohemerythrin [Dissulfurispiraceae bacterium]